MTLYQEGPRDAKVVLVGEAPGTNEVKTGRPFVGYAGDMLNNMLGRVGLNRHECFLTNVCHFQPPGNVFEWFLKKENFHYYASGVMQLKRDIEEIRPNLVIALGAQPLRALTGKTPISDWRGSILESTLVPGIKVIGTYHPAAILRIWDYKAIAEFDLARCAKEAQFPELDLPKRDLIIHPTDEELQSVISEMANADWLAVDIETVYRDDGTWALDCVGFSDRPDRALVLDPRVGLHSVYIRQLLQSPVKKVFQNGNIFDIPVLKQEGFEVENFAWDTMLGMHSLYIEAATGESEMSKLEGKKKQSALRKGLAFQTSIFTREPRYKDDGKLWHETGDRDTFLKYNARDAAVTREIMEVQKAELESAGILHVMWHEMDLAKPLMVMSARGIKIDLAKREELKKTAEEEIERLQTFLDGGAGQPINVESSKQITSFLYDTLKLPEKRNRKTGRRTGDKDAINELAHKHSHPLLLTIVEIRKRRKIIETYLNAKVDPDGRMRCSWDPTGTRSGRLASRASLYGSGTNLQNQPEEMREMFIPDDGHIFVYRDYSQAEARVVAALANDEYLLELFADPRRDIHKETAAAIYGVPVDKVTPEQRYTAKRVRHAVNYGMDAGRFVQVVNEDAASTGVRIDYSTARKVIDGFFMLHPNHKPVYWGGVERRMRQTRTLENAFGRKRTFFGRWDDKLLRDAYSFIPQSSVGDLCCKALINVYHELEVPGKWGVQLMANVHDSLLVQCKREHYKEVAEAMKEIMDIPMTVNGHTIRIPTDCKVGMDWKNVAKMEE
jgi:DNA polymerase I